MNQTDQTKFVDEMERHARQIAYDARNGIATAQKLVTFYQQWYAHPSDTAAYHTVRAMFHEWLLVRCPPVAEQATP